MENLLNKFSETPAATKIMSLLSLIVVTTGLNYFAFIQTIEEQIEGNLSSQATLDQQLIEKKEIRENLTTKNLEKTIAEQKLNQALEELPTRPGLDELLKAFGDLAKKNGIELSVEPGIEASDRYFARIPVRMKVTGNYHEIAMFLQDISGMKRIVNVSNIKLGGATAKGEKLVLSGEFLATTFRFLEKGAAAGGKAK